MVEGEVIDLGNFVNVSQFISENLMTMDLKNQKPKGTGQEQ